MPWEDSAAGSSGPRTACVTLSGHHPTWRGPSGSLLLLLPSQLQGTDAKQVWHQEMQAPLSSASSRKLSQFSQNQALVLP